MRGCFIHILPRPVQMSDEQDRTIWPPVAQRTNNAIYRINRYPVDNVVWFATTYLLDSNLFVGYGYYIHPLNNQGLIAKTILVSFIWAASTHRHFIANSSSFVFFSFLYQRKEKNSVKEIPGIDKPFVSEACLLLSFLCKSFYSPILQSWV